MCLSAELHPPCAHLHGTNLSALLQEDLALSESQQVELLEVTRLFEADKARLEAAQAETLAKIQVRPSRLCACCQCSQRDRAHVPSEQSVVLHTCR